MIWKLVAGLFLRLRAAAWRAVYRSYRGRYSIDSAFRFNGAGIQLYGDGKIELGPDSYIGEFSTLQAADGASIRIGRRCSLSHNVRIYTTTSVADADFRAGPAPTRSASVSIGDGCWIGANCFIAPGVDIGSNAVVGANSVVTHAIPAHEIWGGVPARRIRRKHLDAQAS